MKSQEFSRIADLLARQHKIFVREGNAWAANLKSRVVYYKKKDIYTLPEDHILGFLLHEVAHIHYSEILDLNNEPDHELLHSCLNMLEDHAIEHIISSDYPNAGEILDSTRQEVLDMLVRILPELKAAEHERAMLYASARFEGRGYAKNIRDYEIIGEEISKIMVRSKDEIYNRKRTGDLLPLAKEIIAMLIAKFGQPTPDQRAKMAYENRLQGEANSNMDEGQSAGQIKKALGGQGWQGNAWNTAAQIQFVDKIGDKAQMLGNKLRVILKRNNSMELGGRFRTGKLRAKKLARIRTVKDRRPFGRRIVKSNQSYAFAVASDVSGSMVSNVVSLDGKCSLDYAMSSLYMVAEALRIAGVQRTLFAFAGQTIELTKLNKKSVSWSEICDQKLIQQCQNNHTRIDTAIGVCRQGLANVSAERKIMVILTDGESDFDSMKAEHSKALASDMQCIAIGLGSATQRLQEIFGPQNTLVIKDDAQVEKVGDAFAQILRSTITISP